MYNKIKYKSTWKEVEYFNCKIEELQLKEDKRQNDMEIAAKNLDKVTEEYRYFFINSNFTVLNIIWSLLNICSFIKLKITTLN